MWHLVGKTGYLNDQKRGGLSLQREHVKTSPTIILFKEAKFLFQKGKNKEGLEVLVELQKINPARAVQCKKLYYKG